MIVCSVMMYNRNPMLFVLLVVLTGVSSTLTSTNDTNSSVSTWLQISPEVVRNVPLNFKKQLQEQASKTIPRTRRNAHFGYWPYTRPAVPTLLYGPTPRVHERYIANNVDRRYWPYQMMKNSYYVPPAYNAFTRFPRTKHFYERYIANNVDRWYWPYQMLKNSYYVPPAYNAFTFPRTKHFMKKSRLMLFYNYWSQPRPAHHIPNSIMSTNPTFMDNIFTSSSKPTTPVTPENNYEELVTTVTTESQTELPILFTHSSPSYDDDNPDLAPDTVTRYEGSTSYTTDSNSQSTNSETTGNVSSNTEEVVSTTPSYTEITETSKQYEVDQLSSNQLKEKYFKTVEIFDRNLYQVTFAKLSNSSEEGRQENGISFVQSGLLLHLVLTALSPAMDQAAKTEIEGATGYAPTEEERTLILNSVLSWLPSSSASLKFRRAARLVAAPAVPVGAGLGLRVDRLNGTEGPEELARVLNDMVEKDSGGSLRETFEEDELIGGVCAALLSTAYLRARWRAAPTLLNHSRAFRRPSPAPPADTRALRLTDQVRYADLPDWDAEC
ncbi:hypothetical protein JYU34_011073 [Plutella xylostella]|uniref:Uncharacterized protein n=1 Tax=Plutella xylostella TaxID=51655 RepID=A0ABQ7QHA6_PLUXY|nr:hypothetical protein JYU34_011073 [Plutella xylostella]